MSLVSRILVPVEFSPRCRGAAQYAEALASHFRCEIVLLHVVMPLAHVYGTPEALAYSSASDLTTRGSRSVFLPFNEPASVQTKR